MYLYPFNSPPSQVPPLQCATVLQEESANFLALITCAIISDDYFVAKASILDGLDLYYARQLLLCVPGSDVCVP